MDEWGFLEPVPACCRAAQNSEGAAVCSRHGVDWEARAGQMLGHPHHYLPSVSSRVESRAILEVTGASAPWSCTTPPRDCCRVWPSLRGCWSAPRPSAAPLPVRRCDPWCARMKAMIHCALHAAKWGRCSLARVREYATTPLQPSQAPICQPAKPSCPCPLICEQGAQASGHAWGVEAASCPSSSRGLCCWSSCSCPRQRTGSCPAGRPLQRCRPPQAQSQTL